MKPSSPMLEISAAQLELYDHIDQPICTVSTQGTVHWSNTCFQKTFKSAKGISLQDLFRLSEAFFDQTSSSAKETRKYLGSNTSYQLTRSTLIIDQSPVLLITFSKVQHSDELDYMFQQFIDCLDIVLYIKDDQNNILRCNQAAAISIGLKTEDLRNQPTSKFFPEFAEAYLQDDLEVVQSNLPKQGIIEPYSNPEGEIKWIETTKFPFQDLDGQTRGVFAMVEDITQQYTNQEALKSLESQIKTLHESNEELGQYATKASHDLKGPLSTLSGFISLLENSLAEQITEKQAKYFEFIYKSISYLDSTIKSQLNFARLESKVNQSEVIHIRDLLSDVAQMMDGPLKKVQGTIQLLELPSEIQGNSNRLKQLFQNLIANAIKFHRPGNPPVIQISGQALPDHYEFSVKDNGIGIPDNQREHIFNLYHTGQNNRKDSTGIGLATCQKIVLAHGGEIWVEPTEGQGAHFKFTIAKS